MQQWLTEELKKEVRRVFEPRYGHTLNDERVEKIAQTLATTVEQIQKQINRRKYHADATKILSNQRLS